MKTSAVIYIILAWAASLSPVLADIYVWTDERGVKNFTNTAPPEDATSFAVIEEAPTVSEAAAATPSDESERLRAAQSEIADLESKIAALQSEVARRQAADTAASGGMSATVAEDRDADVVNSYGHSSIIYPYPYGWRAYRWPHFYGHYRLKSGHQSDPYAKYYRRNPGDGSPYYRHAKGHSGDRYNGGMSAGGGNRRKGSFDPGYRGFGQLSHR